MPPIGRYVDRGATLNVKILSEIIPRCHQIRNQSIALETLYKVSFEINSIRVHVRPLMTGNKCQTLNDSAVSEIIYGQTIGRTDLGPKDLR